MHMATMVNEAMFELKVDDKPATRADVLPGWGPASRLGVIIREPFGAVGASLLIQLAVTAFYDAAPARRGASPQYPEIYLFHVGGRYGDHRPFDFWPPRKEVFLRDDPLAVIEALNDRAINVLAFPVPKRSTNGVDPALRGEEAIQSSGAPWSEINSFIERTTTTYQYSADGRCVGGDLTIRGLSQVLEQNGLRATEPERSQAWYQNLTADQLPTALPGPGTLAQTEFWAKTLAERFQEVDSRVRLKIQRQRQARLVDGKATETYQGFTPQQALNII